MSMTAWMMFGQNGQYITSSNLPPDFRTTLQSFTQSNGSVFKNIYCSPDTSGYLILGTGGQLWWYGDFPSDLSAATYALWTGGHTPIYLSWYAPGMWAVFCSDGTYTLGPNVPSQVSSVLAGYTQSNQRRLTEYTPSNLIFSPSGDWLLVGYDQGAPNRALGTYNSSSGFPADVLAAANALTTSGVATIAFDPDGGWAMIDSAGKVTWSPSTPADVVAAANSFVAAGNTITAVQFVQIAVYTLPGQLSLSLTGPINFNTETWSEQDVGISVTYTPPGAQTLTASNSPTFGIAFLTAGTSNPGQDTLSVGFPVSEPANATTATALPTMITSGTMVSINPGGVNQENAPVIRIGLAVRGIERRFLSIPVSQAMPRIFVRLSRKSSVRDTCGCFYLRDIRLCAHP